ncbi:4'-phosphopantetheinyl transferase [Pseudomonas asturiensis]|uniref:4'-phosphopantetheinyl transferase n=1 Tax=Pseudomonas asturiensis TaxID=1190415 RepID=A0A1M7P747_9PSED|nr:4'-phosphopantetheinyl transferase [Pseudomonas asturiensis]
MNTRPVGVLCGKDWLAHPQPDHLPLARQREHVLLVSTLIEPGTSRAEVRDHIRRHLRDSLTQWLGLPLEAITLISLPGHAPRLLIEGLTEPGLSISHENGLSVAAVNLDGPVGIDVMKTQDVAHWQTVALDYLGPQITCELLSTPETLRPLAFVKAWCQREALLKLHGQPLSEWTEHRPLAGKLVEVELSWPWVGVLALA